VRCGVEVRPGPLFESTFASNFSCATGLHAAVVREDFCELRGIARNRGTRRERPSGARGSFGAGFASTGDPEVTQSSGQVTTWVQVQPQLLAGAKADFAKGADGWLVAYAQAKGCVVVTQEVFDPNVKNRVKIPNVCRAFGIEFLDTFAMLRALGVKFS